VGHPVLFQASTIKTIIRKEERGQQRKRKKDYTERVFNLGIKLDASGKFHVPVAQNFGKVRRQFKTFLGGKKRRKKSSTFA
jgi:hypothetical protein